MNFSLLTFCKFHRTETYWIQYFNSIKFGYNITIGGKCLSGKNNPNYGKKWSNTQREHLSNYKKSVNHWVGSNNPKYNNGNSILGELNPFYGKTHTQHTKDKISKSIKSKNIIRDDAYKSSMRKSCKIYDYYYFDNNLNDYVFIEDLYVFCVDRKFNYRSLKEDIRCNIKYKNIIFIRRLREKNTNRFENSTYIT